MQPILQHNREYEDGGFYLVEIFERTRRSGYEHLVLQTTIDLMQKGFITTVNHEPDHMIIGISKYVDATDAAPENRDLIAVKRNRPEALVPAGFIVFDPRLSQDLVHVILGGVAPEFRGSAFYTEIFQELDSFVSARRKSHTAWADVKRITGCYHVDNHEARKMNERLGRKPLRVTTEYVL